jgi:hypothetical protein
MYRIRARTNRIASKLGVIIRPSTNPAKKIDVFIPLTNGKFKKLSIGARGYADYHIYKELELVGKVQTGTAESRRKAYINRHHNDINKVGTVGYYAYQLLWN